MVRSAVDRAFLPAKSLFEQVGDMVILTARTIGSAVRPPYPYGEEFIGQFLFALQLCWFPLLISTVAINFGAPGCRRRTSSPSSARWTGSAASSSSPRSGKSDRS